jgi:hypothetical protein
LPRSHRASLRRELGATPPIWPSRRTAQFCAGRGPRRARCRTPQPTRQRPPVPRGCRRPIDPGHQHVCHQVPPFLTSTETGEPASAAPSIYSLV